VGTPAPVGIAYEAEVARDLARRAVLRAPVGRVVAGRARGLDGAASALIGLLLVAVNFLAAAQLITVAARRSPAAVMGAVLGGYLVRLTVLLGIVLGLSSLSWVDVPVLVLTLAIAHLALLTWEMRYVSFSLGAPGLKPVRK
jgi:multidrug transporter EmrE-like cation transporter